MASSYRVPQLIVRAEVTTSLVSAQSIIQEVAAKYGGSVGNQIDNKDTYIVLFPTELALEGAVRGMAKDPLVTYSERNQLGTVDEMLTRNLPLDFSYDYVSQIPNDLYYGYQWGLEKIKAPEAWGITSETESIVVAVIDTGVDLSHPDLVNKLTPPDTWYDFGNEDVNPQDTLGHGTHVAGIIAAQPNNGLGIAGVGWNAKIMPIKIFPDNSSYYDAHSLAEAIYWATAHGAKIINLSLNGKHSQVVEEAIARATRQGILVVASAGNNNSETEVYPAAYENVLAVAAVDMNDQKSLTSNFGNWVDVSAPGSEIVSTYSQDQYVFSDGTSMAAAYVSGLAALVRAKDPNATPIQVRNMILLGADNIDTSNQNYLGKLGVGRVNAYKTLNINVPNPDYTDDICVVRVNNSTLRWFVSLSSGQGFDEVDVWAPSFGIPGDTLLSGAFTGYADNHGNHSVAIGRLESPMVKKWQVALGREERGFNTIELWNGDFGNAGDKWYVGNMDGGMETHDLILSRQLSPTRVEWWVAFSDAFQFSPVIRMSSDFGNAGDFFLVGDFTGDGSDDIALGRKLSTSRVQWYVAESAQGQLVNGREWKYDFGNEGDIWYVGDFNGDMKDDLILGRQESPSQVKWFVTLSDGKRFLDPSVWINDFGDSGDQWYIGDFNGDGNADLSLVRNVSADIMTWYVSLSDGKSGFRAPTIWKQDLGNPGDTFLIGNFDGAYSGLTRR